MWPSPVFACHGWYRSTKLRKRQLVSSWSCPRRSIISYISLGCTLPTLLTLLITSRWWPRTWSGRTNVRFCKASPHADRTRPRLLIRQRTFLQVWLLIVASWRLWEQIWGCIHILAGPLVWFRSIDGLCGQSVTIQTQYSPVCQWRWWKADVITVVFSFSARAQAGAVWWALTGQCPTLRGKTQFENSLLF